jgi:ubiquitin-conjugating enzyme E2 H
LVFLLITPLLDYVKRYASKEAAAAAAEEEEDDEDEDAEMSSVGSLSEDEAAGEIEV